MENETTTCQENSETTECQEKHASVTEVAKTEDKDSLTSAKDQQVNGNQAENKRKSDNNCENRAEVTSTNVIEINLKSGGRKFAIDHDEEISGEEISIDATTECDFSDSLSVALLRGTVCELERALRDSRALIKTRDEDIASLRKEVEKSREQVHNEQMKWQRKCTVVEERGREIQELMKKLRDSEKTNEELQERIKEFESPYSESDDIVACCSSMNELIELKRELAKKNKIIEEIRLNNYDEFSGKELVAKSELRSAENSQNTMEECDRHNQLKLKFLRDAFFYFMIDFHSDEQIKAILAVLAYGDQREDVILQAYRMRQRGKKFSVKEVSSRGLSFLHEEI